MWRLTLLLFLALATPAHALRLTKPVDTIAAHPLAHSLAAQVEIGGRAPRGALVEVRATCELGPCSTTVVSNRKRRFSALLNVVLPEGRRHLRLRVLSGEDEVARTFALSYVPNTVVGPELTVIGDSLAVGTEPPLRTALPGWRVTSDGRVSRPLAEGMAMLAMTPLDPRPDVLALSLFTNDDPRTVDALEAAVRTSLEAAPCVLWATVVRPPLAGVSYGSANARLRALAEEDDRLRIVDWAASARRHRAVADQGRRPSHGRGLRRARAAVRRRGTRLPRRLASTPVSSDRSYEITPEALAALEAELAELEGEGRREMAERIKTARAWGDLKENSEYHDAKNSQAHLETKILRLQDRRRNAVVVEATHGDTVGLGSKVTVDDGGRERQYEITSPTEADVAAGKLSLESPLAQSLLGAKVGDERAFEAPRGTRTLKVLSVG